jgi:hypothetical protein
MLVQALAAKIELSWKVSRGQRTKKASYSYLSFLYPVMQMISINDTAAPNLNLLPLLIVM